MSIINPNSGCLSSTGTITMVDTGTYPNYYYDESSPNMNEWRYIRGSSVTRIIEKGGEEMRFLYEVILVNPKDEEFEVGNVVARSETAALMIAYNDSDFSEEESYVEFDDLKTKCRVLMEWKKEKSLEKALEIIKKAIE